LPVQAHLKEETMNGNSTDEFYPPLSQDVKEALLSVRYDGRMEIAFALVRVGLDVIEASAYDVRTGQTITALPKVRRGYTVLDTKDCVEFLVRCLRRRMLRRGYCSVNDAVFVRHAATAQALLAGCRVIGQRQAPPNTQVSEGTLRTVDLIEAMAGVLGEYRPDILCSVLTRFALDGGDEPREDPYLLVCDTRALEIYEERDALLPGVDADHSEALYALQDDLEEALADHVCPDDCAFGSTEGDGALFGFWEHGDDEREPVYDDNPDL